MAKRSPLKRVNLSLLRKQYADAKRQLEKSQREYEEAVKALEEGENADFLSLVRSHGITPEELADLLRNSYGDRTEATGGSQKRAAVSVISDEKEEQSHEQTAHV